MRKAVKAIEFQIILDGNGIVNYDGPEQKNLKVNGEYVNKVPMDSGDNVMFAKKNVYVNPDTGEIVKRIKISQNCLGKAIWPDIHCTSSIIATNLKMLYKYMASEKYLLCGDMYTVSDSLGKEFGFKTFSRKGCISMSEAEEIRSDSVFKEDYDGFNGNGVEEAGFYTVPNFELFSKSGERTKNSLYNKETCGRIRYLLSGQISLRELQFICTSPEFGPVAIPNPQAHPKSEHTEWKEHMRENYNVCGDDYEFGYWSLPGERAMCGGSYAQEGIILGQKLTDVLIKKLLCHIFDISICRKNAYKTQPRYMRIRFVTEDMEYSGKWINITSKNQIRDFDLTHHCFYVKSSEEEVTDRVKAVNEWQKEKEKTEENNSENNNKVKSKGKGKTKQKNSETV